MIYPSPDKIELAIDSKYKLVILAAKRAKQLKEGAKPLVVPSDSNNPLTIALEEIAAQKIKHRFDENSLAGREALADKQAVIGAREIEIAPGLDPLAMPEELDRIAEARALLGGDADDALFADDGDDSDETFLPEVEEEEEDNPLLMADDESDASEV